MLIEKICRDCGRKMTMNVKSIPSSRLYCDDCRKKRASKATIRCREHRAEGLWQEIICLRVTHNRNGNIVKTEVLSGKVCNQRTHLV